MIINPTEAILAEAYHARGWLAKYLIFNCGIEPLFIVNGEYFFARTFILLETIRRLPWYYKLLVFLKI